MGDEETGEGDEQRAGDDSAEIRRRLGVRAGDKLEFEEDAQGVRVKAVRDGSVFENMRGLATRELARAEGDPEVDARVARRMTTAIDSNILVALWDADDTLHRSARQLLEEASETGQLVINGLVYAELLAAPGRSEEFLDRFCEETGIRIEWELKAQVCREAGNAYQKYAERRRKQGTNGPRRIPRGLSDWRACAGEWIQAVDARRADVPGVVSETAG